MTITNDIKWDLRFIHLANQVSQWSKDPSTKVGAIIVDKDRRIVAAGYNGAPKGVEEPYYSDRDQKLLRTIHAEANALHFANDVTGCTMYITAAPCAHCAGHIIQRGIQRVVFRVDDLPYTQRWFDSINTALKMFKEADIIAEEINEFPT